MSEEPYFVEVDRIGCSSCGKGTTWTVIGPQGSQHSESWGSEEEAANFAECMNEAYANGRAASLSPKIPAAEPESRSIQRRKALQRGEAMPTFTNRSIEIAELRAAIDEVERMPHQFHCSVHVTPATVYSLVSEDPEENPNNTIPVLPSCTCYKSERLAILRARLAELEKKAEEKP